MIPAGAVQRKAVPPQMHNNITLAAEQNEQTKRRGAAASVGPRRLALLPTAFFEIRTQCRLNYYFMWEHHGRKKRLL